MKVCQNLAGKSLMLSPNIKALWLLAYMQLTVILMVKIYFASLISYMAEAQRKESRAAERRRSHPAFCIEAVRSSSDSDLCVRVRVCAGGCFSFTRQHQSNTLLGWALPPSTGHARLWDRSWRVSSELGGRERKVGREEMEEREGAGGASLMAGSQ